MSRAAQISFVVFVAALAVLAAETGIYLRRHRPAPTPPQTVVTFLSVGDGDCALVQTVPGTTILVDTGGAARAAETVKALHTRHVRQIDLLVLAGPDDGSCGAVPAVLNAFSVRNVWDGAAGGEASAARQAALNAIRRRHVPSRLARAGDNVQMGAATFWTVVWPPPARKGADRLVCRLDFGRTRFLLAGAANADTEEALLLSAPPLACDGNANCTDLVLQTGTPMSAELLWQTAPAVVVVSQSTATGQSPQANALARRTEAAGAALWRTDTQGTVEVRTDGRAPPDVLGSELKQ